MYSTPCKILHTCINQVLRNRRCSNERIFNFNNFSSYLSSLSRPNGISLLHDSVAYTF